MNASTVLRHHHQHLHRQHAGALIVATALLLSSCASGISRTDLAADYYDIANAYYDAGKTDKAAEYYGKAVSLNPKLAGANYNLARIYIETGRITDGINILNDLLKRDPSNVMLLVTRAYALSKLGKYDEALADYNQVLDRNPYDKGALYNAAVVEHTLGNNTKAYDLMKRAQALAPDNADILFKLGTYAADAGETSVAVNSLVDYVKQKPDDTNALDLLGDLYVKEEYYDKALQTYDLVLAKKPSPTVMFKKAKILLTAVEDSEKGLKTLEDALKAGYNDQKELNDLLSAKNLVSPDAVRSLIEKYIGQGKSATP